MDDAASDLGQDGPLFRLICGGHHQSAALGVGFHPREVAVLGAERRAPGMTLDGDRLPGHGIVRDDPYHQFLLARRGLVNGGYRQPAIIAPTQVRLPQTGTGQLAGLALGGAHDDPAAVPGIVALGRFSPHGGAIG